MSETLVSIIVISLSDSIPLAVSVYGGAHLCGYGHSSCGAGFHAGAAVAANVSTDDEADILHFGIECSFNHSQAAV